MCILENLIIREKQIKIIQCNSTQFIVTTQTSMATTIAFKFESETFASVWGTSFWICSSVAFRKPLTSTFRFCLDCCSKLNLVVLANVTYCDICQDTLTLQQRLSLNPQLNQSTLLQESAVHLLCFCAEQLLCFLSLCCSSSWRLNSNSTDCELLSITYELI